MKKANPAAQQEIAQRAREIWSARGKPGGCDTEIWLEAERQLAAAAPSSSSIEPETSRTVSDAPGAFVERVKAETAAESVVEYLISPPISEEEAVKAAVRTQREDGRAPNLPTASSSGLRK